MNKTKELVRKIKEQHSSFKLIKTGIGRIANTEVEFPILEMDYDRVSSLPNGEELLFELAIEYLEGACYLTGFFADMPNDEAYYNSYKNVECVSAIEINIMVIYKDESEWVFDIMEEI